MHKVLYYTCIKNIDKLKKNYYKQLSSKKKTFVQLKRHSINLTNRHMNEIQVTVF